MPPERTLIGIIGKGRLGLRLSKRLSQEGFRHEFLDLRESGRLGEAAGLTHLFLAVRQVDFHVAVRRFGSPEAWYGAHGASPDTPVYSLMAGVPTGSFLQPRERPGARVLLTTALDQPGTIRFVNVGVRPSQLKELETKLGGTWVEVPESDFESAEKVLVAAAVAIRAVDRYLGAVRPREEVLQGLLPFALQEALNLNTSWNQDLEKAWKNSCTPGGITDSVKVAVTID